MSKHEQSSLQTRAVGAGIVVVARAARLLMKRAQDREHA
jgi:hypothetical protein